MFPFIAVLALFALAAGVERPAAEGQRKAALPFLLAGLFLTLFIGLRYHVGADWDSYEAAFWAAEFRSLTQTLAMRDPAYEVLNWTGQSLGLGVWFPNLVSAGIFTWGLIRLARTQPRPWMVIVLAIPYLVTVVSIGYTRQAAAIGFMMAAFAGVARGAGLFRLILYIAGAAVFHRTAVVILPLIALATGQKRVWAFALLIPALYGLYVTFLASSVGSLVYGYIDQDYSSSGAGIRVGLVAIGAAFLLLFRRRLGFADQETALWTYLSIAALACVVLLFTLSSSTAVDRLALYLLPMQMVVLARVPGTLLSEGFGKALLLVYAAAVQIVWLTSGVHAQYWIPYRNFITEAERGTV